LVKDEVFKVGPEISTFWLLFVHELLMFSVEQELLGSIFLNEL